MKQSLVALGVASASVSVSASKSTVRNNQHLDPVYVTTGAPVLEGIDVLFRGGETIIAGLVPTADELPIYYQSLFPSAPSSTDYETAIYSFDSFVLEPIDATLDSNFPVAVALSPAEENFNNLFVSSSASNDRGRVAFYEGRYSTWSLQQILSPSDTMDAANFFGQQLAFDSENYDTLYLGCANCSSTNTKRHGVIYTYKQGGNKAWSQAQQIYFPGVYNLGWEDIKVKGDLLLADISNLPRDTDLTPGTDFVSSTVVLRKDKAGNFRPEQVLAVKSTDINAFDVEENTIILAANTQSYKTATTNAGAVYILSPATLPPPAPGKPRPVQWSVQQVLWSSTPTTDEYFGTSVSLDGDRLSVQADETDSNYIYQRSSNGKWSLQQTLTLTDDGGDYSQTVLSGASLVSLTASTIETFDEYQNDECLVVSLEDQFGDGWDVAKLVVTRPDGSKDYLQNRCETMNPHQVRYCPLDSADAGLYRFSIADASKATNNWEILWRVLNEKTGDWVVGDTNTKLDFEWDATYGYFVDRKVEKTLPNTTCTSCPIRPTEKPTPALRRLKGDDSRGTHNPTHTPAPTVTVSEGAYNWRTLTLTGTSDLWYESEYRAAYYYVSDAKSRRLITKGTVCETSTPISKDCWVDLPDGEYNIRVGGALLRGGSSTLGWSYCKSDNEFNAQQQITVKIEDENCVIFAQHDHNAFCSIVDPTTVVKLDFMVMGAAISDSFSVNDRSALSQGIAHAFPGVSAEDVVISSAVASGSGAYMVSAAVNFRHSTTGYDTLTADGIHTLLSSVETYMAGEGPRSVWSGLQAAEHSNIFHSSTSVQFISAEVVGSKDIPTMTASEEEVVTFADSSTLSTPESEPSSSFPFETISYVGYAVAGVVAALIVGLFVSGRKRDQASLPVAQEDAALDTSKRVQLKDLNLNVPSASDLKELVKDEDNFLKVMLSRR
jgi:hypothetical protein